jgi:hypothetical protein
MHNHTTLSEMNLKGKKLRQAKNKKVDDAVEDQPVNLDEFGPTTKGGKI